jgi:hypothetical protein
MLDPQGTRVIHHADALVWLKENGTLDGCSIVTSLPDVSEFPNSTLQEWKNWFTETASLVMSKCPDNGLTIFYQTDIKKDGEWIDKGFLCQIAAEKSGQKLIAHKIVCRTQPGNVAFGKPGYSHLICFSKAVLPQIEKSLTDVLPDAGQVSWTRGMGINACRLACQMVLNFTDTKTIVDPFCGHGSVLAVANDMGLNAVGVERSLKRVKKAQSL